MASGPPSSKLKALSPDLHEDVRKLSEYLRRLYDQSGCQSLASLGALIPCDKGTLSRFFHGDRVPTWDFIDRILVVAEQQQPVATGEPRSSKSPSTTREQARELFVAALRASNEQTYEVEMAKIRLGDLEAALRRAHTRESELKEILANRRAELRSANNEVENLSRKILELESGSSSRREVRAIEGHRREASSNADELRREVDRLQIELKEESTKRERAEKERDQTKAELERMSKALAPTSETMAKLSLDSQMAAMSALNEVNSGWKPIEAVLVPLAVYIGPFYLGLAFRSLDGASLGIRFLTIAAMALPL